ncbi:type IX secretion system membrane protein PorP/SprF [Cytophaga aurantiaca]|uniref:type IX secretion system membrane protein PorP/SprF n=1 Tax=Cytophaga aurantiaca TaxID=29530 RepID=UPI000361F9EE|nr:type IX secretion system membrane protein PorP/SprF [Cytophaga aurantiaca]
MYTILKFSLRIKPVIGIVFLFFGSLITSHAQLNTTEFEDFTQTSLNPYLINPAAADSSYLFKIRINAIDELGLIKYVNRFYMDIDKRIGTGRKNSYHFIGMQALNSKIGQYISKSRLQFRYSWFTQLSRRASVSAGISLGFINYAFLTTQGGTGGSDFGPDGMLGVHYIRPNTIIGFSMQQIFTPILIPVSQSFKLSRLYNIDISQRFRIAPRIKLTAYGVVQYSGGSNFNYSMGLMTDVFEYVMIGMNNFSLKKTSFNVGVQHIQLYGTELSIVTTYSIYHSVFPTPNSTLELFMAVQL